jgi:hypothetical protein
MYSSFRRTDQSGVGLVTSVRKLLILSVGTFLVRRFCLQFLAMSFGQALIISHLGDKIANLRPERLCDLVLAEPRSLR